MAAIHDLIAQVADERLSERLAAGCAKRFVRLEINAQAVIDQVLLVGTAAQLDRIFGGVH